MCMNCGCGEPDKRHKETDIVRSDIQRAADGQGSSMEETTANLQRSLGDASASSGAGAGNAGASMSSGTGAGTGASQR